MILFSIQMLLMRWCPVWKMLLRLSHMLPKAMISTCSNIPSPLCSIKMLQPVYAPLLFTAISSRMVCFQTFFCLNLKTPPSLKLKLAVNNNVRPLHPPRTRNKFLTKSPSVGNWTRLPPSQRIQARNGVLFVLAVAAAELQGFTSGLAVVMLVGSPKVYLVPAINPL